MLIKEFFLFASSSILFFQEVEKKHRQIKSIRHHTDRKVWDYAGKHG